MEREQEQTAIRHAIRVVAASIVTLYDYPHARLAPIFVDEQSTELTAGLMSVVRELTELVEP